MSVPDAGLAAQVKLLPVIDAVEDERVVAVLGGVNILHAYCGLLAVAALQRNIELLVAEMRARRDVLGLIEANARAKKQILADQQGTRIERERGGGAVGFDVGRLLLVIACRRIRARKNIETSEAPGARPAGCGSTAACLGRRAANLGSARPPVASSSSNPRCAVRTKAPGTKESRPAIAPG